MNADPDPGPVLLVLTNCPDLQVAGRLRRHLVESRLAACVNQLAPVASTYRWKGAVEDAVEIPLLIKTTRAAYPALEAALRQLHPYEVPEIIAIAVDRGLPEYLNWASIETAVPGDPQTRTDAESSG
jgi:periplasmic divalent cation tolerance protein